ncbi:MAG: ShlB/FhaC/HecB family hemolysin secretion/activation protein [Burkholderiaceae bacterium]
MAETDSLQVRRILLEGNTVFSDRQLREAVTGAFEHQRLSAQRLQALRRALTRYYVSRGYANSGALIPEQKVIDGDLRVSIIEGRLTRLDFHGQAGLDEAYLRHRLSPLLGQPLQTDALYRQLSLLQEHPLIEALDARLDPDLALGQARLSVGIVERGGWQWGVGIANDRASGIGEHRGFVQLVRPSLTGWGDPLTLRLGLTRGLRDLALRYERELRWRDWSVLAGFERSSSTVIEAPFDALDIEARTENSTLSLRRHLLRDDSDEIAIDLGLSVRDSRTWLLGERFSFSPGSIDGQARSGAVELGHDWSHRGLGTALASRVALRVGIEAFGSSTAPAQPDTHFVSLGGQARYARRLGAGKDQLVLRLAAQYTANPLLASEQFTIGGVSSVRGYRENRLVRDRGASASIEWRRPLLEGTLPAGLGAGPAQLQGVLFADVGTGTLVGRQAIGPRSLASIGAGLRLLAANGLSAEIFYGHGLGDVPSAGNSLQDRGLHFRLVFAGG